METAFHTQHIRAIYNETASVNLSYIIPEDPLLDPLLSFEASMLIGNDHEEGSWFVGLNLDMQFETTIP